ncbi:hypothetical protein F4779DRAFT_564398 [Xylariaceae sp. FL0662B]|nr:hypothetical protein F4779DRAFT_564398 [Xylariaceae sp. FL0662B]
MANLDPSSSPDPLVDDVPSSARTFTSHTAKTLAHHDLSSFSLPRSSARKTSPSRKSPRKQTFELDVGDERSPQRILVTVEAEEAMKRGINRRLFPPSSPVRNARDKEIITTTTIPLNDEAEGDTSRKRGRARRTSNGTPMPRGKKRAGTPLQKSPRRTRQKGDQGSEAGLLSDVSMRTDEDSTISKRKRRAGNTPKTISAPPAVPSSQLSSNATGRKRGRPRKAPMPESVAVSTAKRTKSGGSKANSKMVQTEKEASENFPSLLETSSVVARDQESQVLTSDNPPNSTPTPADRYSMHESESIRRNTSLPTKSDEADYAMSDDLPAVEAHSDVDSDFEGVEGVTHDGQYTLAHASDFSMIAVDSLPSFQASFNKALSDQPEMGEETNLIINQTLESLRQSTQNDAARQSPARLDVDNSTAGNARPGASDILEGEIDDNDRSRQSRSPKRPKPLPLNRKVFAGKAPHVDDSFSSIPDSVLRAATPGRLPMKSTSAVNQHEEATVYDDSFSEIPEEILEAVTPGRASHVAQPADESAIGSPALRNHINSANRGAVSNLSSSRLPTPDDTSSSNAGSKRAHEDDIAPSTEAQDAAIPFYSDVQSSPPIINRPRNVDFSPPRLNQEAGGTPEGQHSSPQLPPSAKAPSERSKSLEPPPSKIRPSLSPIVRVGRTLQNVMSDRPSPDREGSLGSPFRGSINNDPPRPFPSDPSRQSPVPRSPNQPNYDVSQHNNRHLLDPMAALAQSMWTNFSQGRGSMKIAASDDAGHSMHDYSQTEPSRAPAVSVHDRPVQPGNTANIPLETSSIRVAPPSDDEMNLLEDGDDHQQRAAQGSESQPSRSRSSSIYATRGSDAGQAMPTVDADIRHNTAEEREEKAEEDEGHDGLSDYDEGHGGLSDYDEDDADIWDIEASRPSPEKPETAQTASQPTIPPPRRSKIPSPWRRSSRRLIYQDEITSPSRIEIEEGSQSEPEESFLARSMQRPLNSRQKAHKRLSQPLDAREESPVHLEQQVSAPQLEVQEEHGDIDEGSVVLPEPQALAPLPRAPEEITEPADVSEYSMVAEEKSTEPADVSEFSMVAQQMQDAPTTQEKPVPAKSRLFGGFNIMSFFSSPATLPKRAPDAKEVEELHQPRQVAQPVLKPLQNEPSQSIWSAGLFPSIPQKEFRPSPERRVDLFSPGPALRSNTTIPDTYATTSSSPASPYSPSPAPSQSPSPSTPEQQTYNPIEQKRNFTPRPGQSDASLFMPGPSGSSVGRSETSGGPPELPSDEQDTSCLTDGTDYERVPPREKPSRWDRTLSPSKSCFRSPLKPTTPGRVVAFTSSAGSPRAGSPLAEAQARAEQRNRNNRTTITQGPLFQPISEGRENESTSSSYATSDSNRDSASTDTATTAPLGETTNNNNNNSKPAVVQPPRSAFRLSQTEWTKHHWVRMDEMLQLRRHDPLRFQQLCPLPPRHRRRSAAILGKEVTAQGERVVLEPWHLEVVEAFRHEVGGWDEHALAKRVFALLVGEERRRSGRVARNKDKGKGKAVAV